MASSFAGCLEVNDIAAATVAIAATAAIPGRTQSVAVIRPRCSYTTPLGLPQHPDEHRRERPVFLAVDQQLREGVALGVAPDLPIIGSIASRLHSASWLEAALGTVSAPRRGDCH